MLGPTWPAVPFPQAIEERLANRTMTGPHQAQATHGSSMWNGLSLGLGWDLHPTAPGGPLRLGGIDIPADCHLVGHSDGDVLLHAATDALLGAARLGDIGELFPDSDPRYRGGDSRKFLAEAWRRVRGAGFTLISLDAVVLAESPRLRPHRDAIRRAMAELLGVPFEAVFIKAKTGEGMDAVGKGEAMVAQCVALLARQTDRGAGAAGA